MHRRVLALLLALVGIVGTSLAGVTPAEAKPPAPTTKPKYVALGDSYASGAGLTPYSNAGCYRSATQAYPSLLAGKKFALTFPACSGATTSTLIASQLAAVAGAKYVTVTIGGNDIGFAEILSDCVDSPFTDGCSPGIKSATETALAALPGQLHDVLTAVDYANPGVPVYMSGYPVMFGEFTGTRCTVGTTYLGNLWVTKTDAVWLNEVAITLNSVIKTAAGDAGATYVDAEKTFDGHGRCDTGTAWVNGVILNSVLPLEASERSFHPTAEGQKSGYKAAFVAAGFPA